LEFKWLTFCLKKEKFLDDFNKYLRILEDPDIKQ